MKFLTLGLLIAVALVPAPSWSAASDFEGGFDGWFLVDVNGSYALGELEWVPNGGNPGGFVQFTDEGNDGGFISAPSEYLGVWTGYDGELTFGFDHRILSEGSVSNRLPYEVRIEGPGGEAQFLGPVPPPPSGWIHVDVPVIGSEWTVLEGEWRAILGDVTSFRIRIEQTQGHVDISGIDNVVFPTSSDVGLEGIETQSFRVTDLYPNPVGLLTRVEFANSPKQSVALRIYDLRGRVVFSNNMNASTGNGEFLFDGTDMTGTRLAAGSYFMRLTSGASETTRKFVVVK